MISHLNIIVPTKLWIAFTSYSGPAVIASDAANAIDARCSPSAARLLRTVSEPEPPLFCFKLSSPLTLSERLWRWRLSTAAALNTIAKKRGTVVVHPNAIIVHPNAYQRSIRDVAKKLGDWHPFTGSNITAKNEPSCNHDESRANLKHKWAQWEAEHY